MSAIRNPAFNASPSVRPNSATGGARWGARWAAYPVPRLLLPLVAAALLVSTGARTASAQYDGQPDWNRADDTLAGGLGLHYGKLGGHGLAFRLPVRWWLYAQIAGGVWHTQDHKRHNLGLELNYLLRQDQRLRLYLAAGAAYFYDKEKAPLAGLPENWDKNEDWNVGGGVGVEVLQGQRWSFQVEADFVHDGRHGDTKLLPQAGIYFYW